MLTASESYKVIVNKMNSIGYMLSRCNESYDKALLKFKPNIFKSKETKMVSVIVHLNHKRFVKSVHTINTIF